MIVLVLISCYGCATGRHDLSNLNSTAWVQTSEEYRALSMSAYRTARQKLDKAIANKSWTAIPQQVPGNSEEAAALGELPPAVIMDLDETVLDTRPYQAWLVRHDERYSSSSWNLWVSEAAADAVPGAVAFVKYATERGVKVFYVSNRDYSGQLDADGDGIIESDEQNAVLKEFTVANLLRLGLLPQRGVSNEDSVLLQGEPTGKGLVRKGWELSDKTARRSYLASDYRILLLIGDSLVDFIGYRTGDSGKYGDMYRTFGRDSAARRVAMSEHQARWGESWIILPNPIYGSWERNLYDFADSISTEAKNNRKLDRLDVWK
jgi:acid phosphatase